MIIEISTHGSHLRRSHDRFVITTPLADGTKEKTEIPAEKTDAILITSNAMLSTSAVKLCMEKQIQLVLANWNGQPFARMWSSTPGRATSIRRKQYLNLEGDLSFKICTNLVLDKITEQKKFLSQLKYNKTKDVVIIDKLNHAIDTITDIHDKIMNNFQHQRNFKQILLGYEGICATKYFQAISACLPTKWSFKKRSQNPGLDPFNVSLNYMYGMGYANIEKIIILSGLDPHAGFYHADSFGKPTLVFDLIEICRPMIDKTLVTLFNRRMANETWFENSVSDPDDIPIAIAKNGITLSKSGRSVLSSAYKQEINNLIEKTIWDRCKIIIELLVKSNKKEVTKYE